MSTIIQLTDFEALVLKYLIDQSIDIEDAIVAAMRTNGDIDGESDISDITKAIEGIEKKMGEPLDLNPGVLSSMPDNSRTHAILQAAATLRAVFYQGEHVG